MAVLVGGQQGEQVTAQVGEAQLFAELFLFGGEELLLVHHLEQTGNAAADGVT